VIKFHGRWFSPSTSASSTTKTGCHDIAELLLKVALNTKDQIKSIVDLEEQQYFGFCSSLFTTDVFVLKLDLKK
jgi:hypothetical protein